jgi:hypothetical protein
MNRSDFLKSFLAKGILLTSPFISKAKEKKLVEVLLYSEYVAGFQYADGMKVIDKMKEGDELDLVREPENVHDENAVAVYWKQNRIGYVPAIDNELPNAFLLQGLALKSRIDRLNRTAKPWLACEAGIYLLYPAELLQKNKSEKNKK